MGTVGLILSQFLVLVGDQTGIQPHRGVPCVQIADARVDGLSGPCNSTHIKHTAPDVER